MTKKHKYLNIFINHITNFNNAIKIDFDLVDGRNTHHNVEKPYVALGKTNYPKLKALDLREGNYYKIKSTLIVNEQSKQEWIWELA